jgi:UDP-glucose 4-epimerase
VTEVFQREQPDLVFHLAAQVSVTQSTRDPFHDSDVNVFGTLRLLEAARKCGIEKFIYSSTGGALYGDPETDPCTEEHPVLPVSPYGMSKYIAELYLDLYHRLYQINFTTLRYGNVYGPRQEAHGEAGVVAIFTQAMLEGHQPQIFGDGNQERDFVFVDDVVDANMLAINKGNGGSFNIGTGEKTSVNQIFESLQSIIGYRWGPEHGPARHGDVYKISLDSSKAIRDLGWKPKMEMAEGLSQTVEYFRNAGKAVR